MTALFPIEHRELSIPFRNGKDPLERYYTPRPYAEALPCYLGRRIRYARAWEPFAGGGAIARALEPWCSWVGTTDLDPDSTADITGVDFFGAVAPPCDWIVTNPPYACAAAALRHALTLCPRVAMLLRITMLEACKNRRDILAQTPPTDLLIVGRVSFEGPAGELARATDQSSDQVPHAWFVFDAEADHDNTRITYMEAT